MHIGWMVRQDSKEKRERINDLVMSRLANRRGSSAPPPNQPNKGTKDMTIKWKVREFSALLRDGTMRDYKGYEIKDGPLAVAKVADKRWGIFVTQYGRIFPQKYKTKTEAQSAAAKLYTEGGLDFTPAYAEQMIDACGGDAAFAAHVEQFLGATS